MTYGVYSKDFDACYLSGTDYISAKNNCRVAKGRVVCSEKEEKFGFEVRIRCHKSFGVGGSIICGYVTLGFVTLMWSMLRSLVPNKVVWGGDE